MPSSNKLQRITVLISGNGSNLQALITATGSAALPNCSIVRVLSNRKNAKGLERAKNATIPTSYHNLLSYSKTHPSADPDERYSPAARQAYDADLAKLVLADEPQLVVCAGFMHVLSPVFLNALSASNISIINLHPALPGAFSGADAIQRAYTAFHEGKIERTGLMIHYVIVEVDMGEPILTREVDLRKDESLEDLEQRFHTVEHEAIVEGTRIALSRLSPP